MSAIPDESPTELVRKFKPLGAYLEKQTGMRISWTPVNDYPAVVEGLAARKIDPANPVHKEILDLQRASRFIPTRAENYAGIEEAAHAAGARR